MAKAKIGKGINAPFVEKILQMLGMSEMDPSMFMNPMAASMSPGASLLRNMFKQAKGKKADNIGGFIDDMLKLSKSRTPDKPLILGAPLDPGKAEDVLEIMTRR